MNRSRRNATLTGAILGGVAALLMFAMLVGRFGLHNPTQADGSAVLQVTTGSLYLMVLIVAALGGLFIGAVGFGVGVSSDPEANRFGIGYMLPVSAVVSAVVAYAVLRMGVGWFGDITDGIATIGALRMSLTVLLMGVAAGGVTSGIADALARPELFAFGGEAWPSGYREVAGAMISAVSAPLAAAVVAAAAAIPLSLLLIELEGTSATVVFAIVGAIVLGGTTLAAARPWDRGGTP